MDKVSALHSVIASERAQQKQYAKRVATLDTEIAALDTLDGESFAAMAAKKRNQLQSARAKLAELVANIASVEREIKDHTGQLALAKPPVKK